MLFRSHSWRGDLLVSSTNIGPCACCGERVHAHVRPFRFAIGNGMAPHGNHWGELIRTRVMVSMRMIIPDHHAVNARARLNMTEQPSEKLAPDTVSTRRMNRVFAHVFTASSHGTLSPKHGHREPVSALTDRLELIPVPVLHLVSLQELLMGNNCLTL